MTLQTHAPAPDPAWIAELTAELESYGYKVTKARAPRGTSTEPGRADGAEPVKVKASKAHGACVAHYRVPGMARPVCIAPERDETGQAIAAEWSDVDTVLAFAAAYGHAERDELRALAERDAIARHAEHRPDMRINGRDYKGAPDCWRCEREYRNNRAAVGEDVRHDGGLLPPGLRGADHRIDRGRAVA